MFNKPTNNRLGLIASAVLAVCLFLGSTQIVAGKYSTALTTFAVGIFLAFGVVEINNNFLVDERED